MSTTIVHLIRHGEVHNPEKILYGRLPGYRLSTRGRNQAARTAASLRGHDVVYLAASPLQRAQETAQPCAQTFNLGIVVDEGLIEAGNQLEGLRVRGWRSQLWNPVRWPMLRDPSLPSWGEHYTDIAERMMDSVERARLEAEGHEPCWSATSYRLCVCNARSWSCPSHTILVAGNATLPVSRLWSFMMR